MASPSSSDIVLCTLNAKYIHASLGLRYLLANMGDLEERTVLREFTIARKPQELADELLALQPRVIGLGVYIWNVTETTELVRWRRPCGLTSRWCWVAPRSAMSGTSKPSCNCPTM